MTKAHAPWFDAPETTEVYDVRDLEVGDVIAYPALTRREHGGTRSQLRVTAITTHGANVKRLPSDGSDHTYVVFVRQIEDNGVLLADRTRLRAALPRAANSQSRGDS